MWEKCVGTIKIERAERRAGAGGLKKHFFIKINIIVGLKYALIIFKNIFISLNNVHKYF